MSDETEQAGEILQSEREAYAAMEAARAQGAPKETLGRYIASTNQMRERRLSLYTTIARKEGRRV